MTTSADHAAMVAGCAADSIAEVIRNLVAGYVRLYRLPDPCWINDGQCDQFARDVAALVPGAAAVWGDAVDAAMPGGDSHCVVRHGGRYHDSDTPGGVASIRAIPYFRQSQQIHDLTCRDPSCPHGDRP